MRHPSKHQALQRALQWHSGSEHHALNLGSNDPFASHLWLWVFQVNADTTTPKRCFNPGPFGKPTHGSTWEFCHFLWPWMIHLQLHRPAGGSSLVSKGCGFLIKSCYIAASLGSCDMEFIVSYDDDHNYIQYSRAMLATGSLWGGRESGFPLLVCLRRIFPEKECRSSFQGAFTASTSSTEGWARELKKDRTIQWKSSACSMWDGDSNDRVEGFAQTL